MDSKFQSQVSEKSVFLSFTYWYFRCQFLKPIHKTCAVLFDAAELHILARRLIFLLASNGM